MASKVMKVVKKPSASRTQAMKGKGISSGQVARTVSKRGKARRRQPAFHGLSSFKAHVGTARKQPRCGQVFVVHVSKMMGNNGKVRTKSCPRDWPDGWEFPSPQFGKVFFADEDDRTASEPEIEGDPRLPSFGRDTQLQTAVLGVFKKKVDADRAKARALPSRGVAHVVTVPVYGTRMQNTLHLARGVAHLDFDCAGHGACILGAYTDKAAAVSRAGLALLGINAPWEYDFEDLFTIKQPQGTKGYQVIAEHLDCAGSVNLIMTAEMFKVR